MSLYIDYPSVHGKNDEQFQSFKKFVNDIEEIEVHASADEPSEKMCEDGKEEGMHYNDSLFHDEMPEAGSPAFSVRVQKHTAILDQLATYFTEHFHSATWCCHEKALFIHSFFNGDDFLKVELSDDNQTNSFSYGCARFQRQFKHFDISTNPMAIALFKKALKYNDFAAAKYMILCFINRETVALDGCFKCDVWKPTDDGDLFLRCGIDTGLWIQLCKNTFRVHMNSEVLCEHEDASMKSWWVFGNLISEFYYFYDCAARAEETRRCEAQERVEKRRRDILVELDKLDGEEQAIKACKTKTDQDYRDRMAELKRLQ